MMSPETVRHVSVKSRVWLELRNAIERSELTCSAFADGVGIRIDEWTVREPDVSVQCKPADPDSLTIDEPIIVVEVVSPSSARADLGEKVVDYFRVPSVRYYLIVDPIARIVIVHSVAQPGGTISTKIVRSGTIDLDPPGVSVSVEDMLEPAT